MEDTGTQVFGGENEQETVSAFELQQIFLAIIPESEDIKATFIRWVSLPSTLKDAMEKRLDEVEAYTQGSIFSVRDAYMSKIYSMGKILLQVFEEWDHIQDTEGAPGVVSGYCCLTKSLETDINNSVQYFQGEMEKLIGQYEIKRHTLASQSIIHRLRSRFGFTRGYGNQDRSNYDLPGPETCRLTERLVSTRSSISDTVVSGSEAVGLIGRHGGFFLNDPEKLRLDALTEGCQNRMQSQQSQCSSSSSSEYGDSRSGTEATGSSSDDEPNVSAMSQTGSEDCNEY